MGIMQGSVRMSFNRTQVGKGSYEKLAGMSNSKRGVLTDSQCSGPCVSAAATVQQQVKGHTQLISTTLRTWRDTPNHPPYTMCQCQLGVDWNPNSAAGEEELEVGC